MYIIYLKRENKYNYNKVLRKGGRASNNCPPVAQVPMAGSNLAFYLFF